MTNDSDLTGKPGNEIVFDAKSGISEEEQREILLDINSIAEKNRQSLSSAAPAGKIKAKKNNGLFPLAVNGIAIALLAGGFFLLSSFHGKEDVRLREGTMVYSPAERALIDEIRKETFLLVEAKENEISQIIAKMTEVDLLISGIHSSNLELTEEQRLAEENLKQLQGEYRVSLSALQDDRSRILDSARAREAALFAQLEARTKELTAVSEQKDAALNAAMGELDRLSFDQDKAAVIESQLAASFTGAADRIRSGQYAQAIDILAGMRLFLNTPSFQGIRSVQARKETYERQISVLETLAEDAQRNSAFASGERIPAPVSVPVSDPDTERALEELMADNARLEETVASLNRTIAASSSRGSGTAQRLAELEASTATLHKTNIALESAVTERQEAIAALESRNTTLSQTVATRDSEISALQTRSNEQEERIRSLDTQLTTLRQAIQALSQ